MRQLTVIQNMVKIMAIRKASRGRRGLLGKAIQRTFCKRVMTWPSATINIYDICVCVRGICWNASGYIYLGVNTSLVLTKWQKEGQYNTGVTGTIAKTVQQLVFPRAHATPRVVHNGFALVPHTKKRSRLLLFCCVRGRWRRKEFTGCRLLTVSVLTSTSGL